MNNKKDIQKTVMVIGAGPAGLEAALDSSGLGLSVCLVDAGLDLSSDDAAGGASPMASLAACVEADPRIEVLKLSEVLRVEGSPGDFHVTVKESPAFEEIAPCRFCEGCDLCGGSGSVRAVFYEDEARERTIDVAAIILSGGLEAFDAESAAEYGYRRYPDVVTSVDLDAMLAGGAAEILRPSDGVPPKRIAFIQCVGSRSRLPGRNRNCSGLCCARSLVQAVALASAETPPAVSVFHAGMRPAGRGAERLAEKAAAEHGVNFIRAIPSGVREAGASRSLLLRYAEGDLVSEEEFDMVVLAVGFAPSAETLAAARALSIDLDAVQKEAVAEPAFHTEGVYLAGPAAGSRDTARMVTGGAKAAAQAGEFVRHLASPEPPAVSGRALVIGGGASGMTAAVSIAAQGFEVTLVESTPHLGGGIRGTASKEFGRADYVAALAESIADSPRIDVVTSGRVVEHSGRPGAFVSRIETPDGEREVHHGVTVVATGAVEYKPDGYLYGKDPRAVTAREFAEMLASGDVNTAAPVVIVQCVGSRTQEHPYCSRICCLGAVRHALKVKELSGGTPVYILNRDVRTFGRYEEAYRSARAAGVLFVPYDPCAPPEVSADGDALLVRVPGSSDAGEMEIKAGTLVLSAAVVPAPGTAELARVLSVDLDEDGFFLSADEEYLPVDIDTDGIFVAGLAHGPKLMAESIAEALAASGRAVAVLSRQTIAARGGLERGP